MPAGTEWRFIVDNRAGCPKLVAHGLGRGRVAVCAERPFLECRTRGAPPRRGIRVICGGSGCRDTTTAITAIRICSFISL